MSNGTFEENFAGHLLGLSRGFMASRIFLTAVELNVFGLLDTGRSTSVEMASRMSTDLRATEILLNALTGMGLLEKKGDEFANIKVLAELLLPDRPGYLSGFGNAIHLWDAWSHLTEIVRTGRPFIAEQSEGGRQDFALCMKSYAQGTIMALTNHVDFSDVSYMLDLGGGIGAHAIALARQHRQMRIVLFDKDAQALELAGFEIAREGLNHRIRAQSGDFLADDLGQGYDLILLSSVICLFGEEQNLSLLRRVWTSLVSGGRIVILDSIVDTSRTRPAAAALFAVNMLITSHGGQSHSHNQVEEWLRSAGFEDARRIPLHGSQIIIAKKGHEEDSERGL